MSAMTPYTVEHIMQFFKYSHLTVELQDISKPFSHLAGFITATVPRNPERTVALRKLLEAKDSAVRAYMAKDESSASQSK